LTETVTNERRARLEERLQGYHGEGMAEVLDMLDYLRDDGDTVIAGGSLSIDQGNSQSDLDMVLVGPNTKTSAVPFEHWVGSLRIDAWKRSTDEIDALFRQAEAALASDGPLLNAFGNAVQEQQLKLLHRIAFGVLIEGEAIRPATERGTSELALDLLTREYAERSRESAMIAGLAIASGRELLAATVARVAVEEALHSVLHGQGVPFSGDKWLREQLNGHDALKALHEELAELPPRGVPLEPYVQRALAVASQLIGLDLTPAALGPDLHWTYSGLQLMPLGGRKLLASSEHGTAWELEPEEAEAWSTLAAAAAATGEGEETAAGAIAGTFPHPTDDAQIAICVRLYEAGVLKLAWQRGLPLAELDLDLKGAR
jgi:hypothetical protein